MRIDSIVNINFTIIKKAI